MKTYKVLIVRTVEWESTYEADDERLAIGLAQLEAMHGTIVDEQISVQEVHPAKVA